MIKTYPKTHEDIFSSDKKNHSLVLDAISIDGMEMDEYISFFKNFLRDSYNSKFFDTCVKFAWLRRKFVYFRKKAYPQIKNNSVFFHGAFIKFMRRNVGINPQEITRSNFNRILEPYFDIFFPGFDEGNPFENPEFYEFPFKNISIDFLGIVRYLDEKMELLKLAEERKMSYATFGDYVINYVLSVNESLPKPKYEIYNNGVVFLIKKINK